MHSSKSRMKTKAQFCLTPKMPTTPWTYWECVVMASDCFSCLSVSPRVRTLQAQLNKNYHKSCVIKFGFIRVWHQRGPVIFTEGPVDIHRLRLQSGTSFSSAPCSAFILWLSCAELPLVFPLFYANGCSNGIYRSEVYATCNAAAAAEPHTHSHSCTHTLIAEKTKCPPRAVDSSIYALRKAASR